MGAYVEDEVLRLTWERSIPIAFPTGAWFGCGKTFCLLIQPCDCFPEVRMAAQEHGSVLEMYLVCFG